MNRISRRRPARILYYSHDSFGLGHLRRSLALAGAARRRMPGLQQVIVTGSPVARELAQDCPVELVQLPPVVKLGSEHYVPREAGSCMEKVLLGRAGTLLSTARAFNPDLVVIDHAPRGLLGEALPLLDWLREHRPATRVVLGLRDIIDSPWSVRALWQSQGIYPLLEHAYDRVLVYGDRSVYDTARAYAIPASVQRRLRHVGYLGRVNPVRNVEFARMAGEGRRVLVTAGGGGDGQPIFDAALAMAEEGLLPAGDRLHLVLGPLLDLPSRIDLHCRAAKLDRIRVTDFAPQMSRLWSAADAVITMGGYNCLTEVVSQRLPAVVVPRTHPRREQLIRARAFQQGMGGQLQLLCPDQLGAANLASALRALPPRRGARSPIDLGGLGRFAEEIAGLLDMPRRSAGRTLDAAAIAAVRS